jgi:hypothetical protein
MERGAPLLLTVSTQMRLYQGLSHVSKPGIILREWIERRLLVDKNRDDELAGGFQTGILPV